jgi:hypothetical protein
MSSLPRWLVLSILIALAVLCYAIGFNAGAGLFLIIGGCFELAFWFKLIRRDR